MKKNENKSADVNGSNDKIHISKSIFETNRELQKKADEQEKKRQEELEKKLAQRKKKPMKNVKSVWRQNDWNLSA